MTTDRLDAAARELAEQMGVTHQMCDDLIELRLELGAQAGGVIHEATVRAYALGAASMQERAAKVCEDVLGAYDWRNSMDHVFFQAVIAQTRDRIRALNVEQQT